MDSNDRGNTFAVIAFEISQPRPYATAHHLHAAAQIIASARHHVPCLLLVRDPVEAVISHLQREPRVTPRQALTNWSVFHERVLPCRDHFVLGDFREVTTDYGNVIRAVNALVRDRVRPLRAHRCQRADGLRTDRRAEPGAVRLHRRGQDPPTVPREGGEAGSGAAEGRVASDERRPEACL